MKLSEVFSQLTYGELSQISLGGGEQGEISENRYIQVVCHINLGLTALYSRFALKEKQLVIPLQADANTYRLDLDDLLKIERVTTDSGYDLPLNDGSDMYSCRTPTLKSIRVPQEILNKDVSLPDNLKTDSLTVTYRANHPKLEESQLDFGPENVEVELPYSHLEALLYFVASRVFNPIGLTPQTEFNAGNNYYAKYEAACRQLEGKGVQTNDEHSNTRASRNGWV